MPLNSSQHSAEIKKHFSSAYTLFLNIETNYVGTNSNSTYKIVIFSELILLRHHENSRLEVIQKPIYYTE